MRPRFVPPVLSLILAAVGLLTALASAAPEPPLYQGKPLAFWGINE